MNNKLENIYRERVDFSKLKTAFPMPDLLAIQKQSYAEFLQMELLPEERQDNGLSIGFYKLFYR
jgi:DNA-directed RNA polymerase subunit beta